MIDLISEIKKLLSESSVKTPALDDIERFSDSIERKSKEGSFKASNSKKKTSKKSDVEEDEDIVSKSEKDLGTSDKEENKPDQKVKTGDESPSTINLADAQSFEKLIDVLNQFRAAHSFTDEAVSSRLRDYFDSLEREEKEVLHVFIKGLVQITVLDVDGKDAYTPDKLMFNITKTGAASSEKKKSMKRKIDKKDSKDKSIDGMPIVTIGNVSDNIKENHKSKLELIQIVKNNNL